MRAFLSSQYGVDSSLVENAIRHARWDMAGASSVVATTRYPARELIEEADAVLVVGGSSSSSELGFLLVEVGIALGLDKPVLVLWEQSAPLPNGFPSELPIVRVSLRNPEALRFHIGVFLADVRDGSSTVRSKVPVRASLQVASELSTRLLDLQAQPSLPDNTFLHWIEDLFLALGAKSVPTARGSDRGFDLVLSAPFDSGLVGPVLVEAKLRMPSSGDQLRRLTERLGSTVASERASLGVVIVLAGADLPLGPFKSSSPYVSIFGANELIRLVASQRSLSEILMHPELDGGRSQ